MDPEPEVSVVVPTLARQEALTECLASVGRQTHPPAEVVVVNDGDLSADRRSTLRESLPSEVAFEVVESRGTPSSSTSRNTGIEVSTGDVVLFLDDDVVIGEEYVERLLAAYDRYDDDDLAGIGGFDDTPQSPSRVEELFNRLFYLGTELWTINEAGMQYPIGKRKPDLDRVTESDWLPTNNASFKRSVLEDHRFPHWDPGREPLEDVAFGWGLANDGYHCLLDPSLSVEHRQAEDGEGLFEFGVKHGRNRVRMFRRYGRRRFTPLFLWALLGHLLRVFLAPVIAGDIRQYWSMGAGMAVGSTLELLTLRSILEGKNG